MSKTPEEIRKKYETIAETKEQIILRKIVNIVDRMLEQKGEDLIRNEEIVLDISSIEHSFTDKMMEEMGIESFDRILQIIKDEYRKKWDVKQKVVVKKCILCFSEKKDA